MPLDPNLSALAQCVVGVMLVGVMLVGVMLVGVMLGGASGSGASAAQVPPTGARAAAAPGWLWPLDPVPRVIAAFRAPLSPYGPGHRGVDLAARVGQPVLAAGPGTVAFAGAVAGRGVVSIQHPDGRRTTYEPVVAVVEAGDRVAAGARLGTLSAAPGHCLPGTCLHWGLRRGEVYLDPLTLLGRAHVRLLPVWTGRVATPRLAARQLRAGRGGPQRAGGSRRARCRHGRRAGRIRAPPRW